MVEKLRAANMPVEMMVQRLLLLDEVHVKFPLTDAGFVSPFWLEKVP